jgi:homoserine O-acetyltransferase/O-succinyltransferase
MGLIASAFLAAALATSAADAPPRQESDFVIRDFRFHTGESLPELKQHYVTLGDPKNPAVLVLHGTGGNGGGLLNVGFGGELFGPGQPLDASRYFIILPDTIGSGKSSKPSDGLRMKFPRYTYEDMIVAQHQLLTEHLGVKRLKLVLGNSMGGMLTWMWGEAYPDFMDGLVPLASTPAAMASRNWAMRRLMVETIKADPAFQGGNYTSQPPSLRYANAFFSVGTSGGTRGWQARAGSHAEADHAVDQLLAGPLRGDANDTIYQFDASRDYDPAPRLDRIKARVLAINSADDERNPVETGVMEKQMARLSKGSFYLIPASEKTSGHGTTGNAALWKGQLASWLLQIR